MKTSVKILILLCATIFAIGFVAYFVKSRVAPPSEITLVNQYQKDIDQRISRLPQNVADTVDLRNGFFALDTILWFNALYGGESRIENDHKDANLKKAVSVIGDHYVLFGNNLLSSRWRDSDIEALDFYAQWLEYIYDIYDKNRTVLGGLPDEVNRIVDVYKSYKKAVEVSRISGFSSSTLAIKNIDAAERYKKDKYLKNNQELKRKLEAVPGNIKKSCNRYYSRKISELEVCENWNFNELADSIDVVTQRLGNKSAERYCNDVSKLINRANLAKQNCRPKETSSRRIDYDI